MGSDFNRDPGPSKAAKCLDHPSFRCRHLIFAKNLAFAAQYAVAAVPVSQIHSNRDGLLRPLGFRRRLRILSRTATLLTSSAYLGAYRIPWTPAFSFHLVNAPFWMDRRRSVQRSSVASVTVFSELARNSPRVGRALYTTLVG